jgi:hypothetical protein
MWIVATCVLRFFASPAYDSISKSRRSRFVGAWSQPMVRLPRCPYCVVFDNFMVMNSRQSGLRVCAQIDCVGGRTTEGLINQIGDPGVGWKRNSPNSFRCYYAGYAGYAGIPGRHLQYSTDW